MLLHGASTTIWSVTGLYSLFPAGKITCLNMFSCLLHQPPVKCKVVNTGNGITEKFFCLHQMPEIGLAVIITDFTIQSFINGRKIIFPFFIINIDDPFAGKQHCIAAVAGWHHTVKHINAHADTFQDIPGCAHSHQVSWFFFGQMIATPITDFIHHRFRFTNT